MRNEAYPDNDDYDSDEDSDDDSDYGSDDDSSHGDDDNYDDFIAGVEQHNSDPPDPPDANINETPHEDDEDSVAESDLDEAEKDDDGNDTVDISENETDDIPEYIPHETPAAVIPTSATLKNLTDNIGVLPPTIQSRTRQQAQNNGESLLTGAHEWKTVKTVISKKQRKLRKEMQSQLRKKEEEGTKRKLRNKLKNAKRKLRHKNGKKAPNAPGLMIDEILEAAYEREHGHLPPTPFGFSGCMPKHNPIQVKTVNDTEEPEPSGNLRDQLRSEQKPEVCLLLLLIQVF